MKNVTALQAFATALLGLAGFAAQAVPHVANTASIGTVSLENSSDTPKRVVDDRSN